MGLRQTPNIELPEALVSAERAVLMDKEEIRSYVRGSLQKGDMIHFSTEKVGIIDDINGDLICLRLFEGVEVQQVKMPFCDLFAWANGGNIKSVTLADHKLAQQSVEAIVDEPPRLDTYGHLAELRTDIELKQYGENGVDFDLVNPQRGPQVGDVIESKKSGTLRVIIASDGANVTTQVLKEAEVSEEEIPLVALAQSFREERVESVTLNQAQSVLDLSFLDQMLPKGLKHSGDLPVDEYVRQFLPSPEEFSRDLPIELFYDRKNLRQAINRIFPALSNGSLPLSDMLADVVFVNFQKLNKARTESASVITIEEGGREIVLWSNGQGKFVVPSNGRELEIDQILQSLFSLEKLALTER